MHTHAIVFDKYFRYALRYRGTETIKQHKALLECALKRDIKSARAVSERAHQWLRRACAVLLEGGGAPLQPLNQPDARSSGTIGHR